MKIRPTPETIWTRPAYSRYIHPRITDEVIRKAERQLGVTLPNDFLDVLRVQNGGSIRFHLPDAFGDSISGIGKSVPSLTFFDWTDDQEYVDFSLEGLVPFDGDGHWCYCLDFRSSAESPSITYIVIDSSSQEIIADSFTSFMGLMELRLENELVLKGVKDIDDARVQLEKLFKLPFERDVSNIGVPYLHCKTGKKWNNSFSITDNKVARSYSGEEPDEFRFKGKALLFPELDRDAVIFEGSEKNMEMYREKLTSIGLELVDIESAATEL